MLFPVLGAHFGGAEFQYSDLIWKEMCGQMAHLVAAGNNLNKKAVSERLCASARVKDRNTRSD
jgi:hypothetical protein